MGKPALFRGIAEDDYASLLRCLDCRFKSFRKDQAVFRAGDSVRAVGIVISGRVRIVKDDAWGNRNIIEEVPAGEMFAEAFICGGADVLPVSVIAAAATEIMFADLRRIVTTCPSACAFHARLVRNMLGAMARKNIRLASKLEHITRRTTRQKLLSYLSEQSRTRSRAAFEIPFDRQGLADYLSVDRSALSAEMSRLKADGVIDYRKNHFELLRRPS